MNDYQHIIKTIKKKGRAFEKRLIKLATVKNALFTCLLLIFFLVFFSIATFDRFLLQETEEDRVLAVPFALPPPAAYPVAVGILGVDTISPSLSAHSAIIIDNDSKVVLFAKNPTLRFSMASTTKIMTALVALEHFNLYDVLTIQSDPREVEGATVGFIKGEKVFFEDLLYAMLLPSGNDAAVALAQNYPGGEKAFVEKMNKKAEGLHLFNTYYVDPSGLNDNNYTTVFDLANLASVALKQQTLSHIVSTKKKVIRSVSGNVYSFTNLNKLLGANGVFGMKTGFTDEAGGVLVTLKKEGERTFILVVMKSDDRFADTEKLIFLISGKVQFESMSP